MIVQAPIRMVVSNNFVNIAYLDPVAERILDRELKYQTILAYAQTKHPDGWDGKVSLLRKRGTGWYFPSGLLSRACNHLKRMRFTVEVDDRRIRPALGQPVAERVVPLFDYQQEAVEAAVQTGRGVVDCPPRSGKTRLFTEIVRQLGMPCIWVAPTRQIVKQSVDTLKAFLGDSPNIVYPLVGGNNLIEASQAHIVVCTTATAAQIGPEFFKTRQMLVVDEWHHAAAVSYRRLFQKCAHIYFRYGMTGTNFRSGYDGMAMEALLGDTIFKITSRELVDRGRLVPLDVVFVPTQFDRLRNVNSQDFIGGFGRFGAFEHLGRNHMISNIAARLVRHNRKVVILVRTKAQGHMIAALIEKLVSRKVPGAQYNPVEFVSTDKHRRHIEGAIDAFVSSDEVRILIGTSLIGEGTDLPVADALIYAAAGKSEVQLMQNAYRVCTMMDGKPKRALMIDFADRHHGMLMAQSLARLKVYWDEPIFYPRVMVRPSDIEAYLAEQK